jgi:arginyl-tRNA synthetase
MLLVKQELLAALANTLESFSPGAGARRVRVSQGGGARRFRKHCCNATRQSLGRKPRELAEELSAALLAKPAFEQWVQAVEIAGPGFLNIRLKAAAKQQVVREVLVAGEAYGRQPATGEKVLVVRLGQPDRPTACGPRPPGGVG